MRWPMTRRKREDYTTRREVVGKDDEPEEMTDHEAWTALVTIADANAARRNKAGLPAK